MFAFLNERSLERRKDSVASLTEFLIAAQKLQGVRAILFRDSAFFGHPTFKKSFNGLTIPSDVRGLIRELVFGDRYYQCWRASRLSTEDEFFSCEVLALTFYDESVSEAAERSLRNGLMPIALLSATDSVFGSVPELPLAKESSGEVTKLPNVTLNNVNAWIASQRGHYDRASSFAPRDFQTILGKDPGRFRPTGKTERQHSRRIFEEIETGRHYYVDESHSGAGAHLEVFSARGEHLGTASIDTAELDSHEREAGRVVRL